MEEIWKVIEGFENYEVSNFGQVRNIKTQKIIKQHIGAGGYPTVYLKNKSLHKTALVHRAVAKAFIPNPFNKPIVNHINAIRNDYRIENLEWATLMENVTHMLKLGRQNPRKGERHPKAKLTEQQVLQVKQLNGLMSVKDIALKFGVKYGVIDDILNFRTWRHLK